jgi:hypothetical protein
VIRDFAQRVRLLIVFDGGSKHRWFETLAIGLAIKARWNLVPAWQMMFACCWRGSK